MKNITYKFNEDAWGMPGIGFNYDSTPELEDEVTLLRELYTEISAWGDLSIFTAWGSYSQDNFDLKWHPVDQRDDVFLGYLYHVEQSEDQFHWSNEVAQQSVNRLYD